MSGTIHPFQPRQLHLLSNLNGILQGHGGLINSSFWHVVPLSFPGLLPQLWVWPFLKEAASQLSFPLIVSASIYPVSKWFLIHKLCGKLTCPFMDRLLSVPFFSTPPGSLLWTLPWSHQISFNFLHRFCFSFSFASSQIFLPHAVFNDFLWIPWVREESLHIL